MITCPNCNHQNPDGALQCEACYTPLPEMVACPSCATPVQADASFCGQCGYDLRGSLPQGRSSAATEKASSGVSGSGSVAGSSTEVSAMPDSSIPTQNFLVEQTPVSPTGSFSVSNEVGEGGSEFSSASNRNPAAGQPDFELPDLVEPDPLIVPEPMGSSSTEASLPVAPKAAPEAPATPTPDPIPMAANPVANPVVSPATQLQTLSARLRQVQTSTVIEIPRQLSVVRIGKPNDQTPPDIDVSGFPDSEVVSRVHANLRIEGDIYYIEDVGSSNGTYINGLPLAAGNRHRLRPGDRIALGKGDKVSFIFETA